MAAKVPEQIKIYHITHLGNLPQIIDAGNLWSDSERLKLKLTCEVVGIPHIKRRRLEGIDVDCHPGTKVGHYVPFNFCPRSVMLFILYRGNNPDITYREGQRPLIHLCADLTATVRWLDAHKQRWAFTDRNAGTRYATFYADLQQLGEINWAAIQANDFRDSRIKEGKQAEFLVHGSFPWQLVETIGVLDQGVADSVQQMIAGAAHKPTVTREPAWYY